MNKIFGLLLVFFGVIVFIMGIIMIFIPMVSDIAIVVLLCGFLLVCAGEAIKGQ